MNVDRSSQLSAIVIRISPFGESHAMVDLLTPHEGLLPGVAYGLRGRRSSLRGKLVPFARGTAWLYTDPRQDRSKITDFDVDRYALNLTADLDAYYEASLWAEVVWRSHASGSEGETVFRLLDQALDVLDRYPTRAGDIGSVVLWRYLDLMGLQPDLDHCARSERPFRTGESRFYDQNEDVLVCAEWAAPEMGEIDGPAAQFLEAVGRPDLDRDDALFELLTANPPAKLPSHSRGMARRFVVTAIQNAVSIPLNTLKVSGGLRGMVY
ncbi:MAG: DNA repair protein RecO [Alkalispirochaeta sp.]